MKYLIISLSIFFSFIFTGCSKNDPNRNDSDIDNGNSGVVEIPDFMITANYLKLGVGQDLVKAEIVGENLTSEMLSQAIWNSSNPKVLTVDSVGNINPIDEGEAEVSATIKDKSAKILFNVVKYLTTPLTPMSFREKVWDYKKNGYILDFKGDKIAVIDFTAQWCINCKGYIKVFNNLYIKYHNDVDFYYADIDYKENGERNKDIYEALRKVGIDDFLDDYSIPVILLINKEGQYMTVAGRTNKEKEKKIESFIKRFSKK